MRTPVFTAREVMQFAVKNEQDGEAFYRKIAKHTAVPAVRTLFLMLAKEESQHARIFKTMLSEVDERETIATDSGEYVDYMTAYYMADILFSANRLEELPPSPDPVAALDFGIQRELDSITCYMQAQELVPDGQAKLIAQIIEEERGHFLKFSELKREYLAKGGSFVKRTRRCDEQPIAGAMRKASCGRP